MSNNKLDCTIFLINRFNNFTREDNYIYGTIIYLINDDIQYLNTLLENELIEISNPTDNSNINLKEINKHLNKNVSIEFKIGAIGSYYETREEFVNKNKFNLNNSDYYIKEINYRSNNSISNEFIKRYETNIKLINFLKKVCDYEKSLGMILKLFYYKTVNGIELDIDYTFEDLYKINFTIEEKFIDKIQEPINGNDKKQLFINELINFLDKNGNSFQKLILGWETLLLNYERSYSLFLSGFSFDKIKNSSTEYFQNIADRIYDSIAKASNYIFGVPIGFIFLINNFDFTGNSILKNSGVLFLGILFFIMIWYILFNNINQSIKAIEKDLERFLNKIKTIKELNEIYTELLEFKDNDIQQQYRKIVIVKILTSIIFGVFVYTYIYIYL